MNAAYNNLSFNVDFTDLSPIFKWGIARLDPTWAVDFTNMTDGNRSMASYTPWSSPTNYTGPIGVGVSSHSARAAPLGPSVLPPQLVLNVDATAVYVYGTRDPDSVGSESKSSTRLIWAARPMPRHRPTGDSLSSKGSNSACERS